MERTKHALSALGKVINAERMLDKRHVNLTYDEVMALTELYLVVSAHYN